MAPSTQTHSATEATVAPGGVSDARLPGGDAPATSEVSPDAGTPAKLAADKHAAVRRLNRAAAGLAAAAAVAALSAWAPWYAMNLADGTLITERQERVDGVEVVDAEATARDLVRSRPLADTGGMPREAAAPPSSWAGMPVPHVLLAIAGALGLVGAVLRSGLAGLLGVGTAVFAWRQLSLLRDTVESAGPGGVGGDYLTARYGLEVFQIAVPTVGALCLLCAVQAAVVNHRRRALERAAATAAGAEAPPTLPQLVWSMVSSQLTRFTSESQPGGEPGSNAQGDGPTHH